MPETPELITPFFYQPKTFIPEIRIDIAEHRADGFFDWLFMGMPEGVRNFAARRLSWVLSPEFSEAANMREEAFEELVE